MEFSDLFTLKKFVAPVLIQISYWVGLIFIVLMTLVGIAGTSLTSSYYYGGGGGFSIGGALLSLLGGVFAALIWRVVCEIWIVIFSVNDRLGKLVELKQAERRP